MISLFFGLKKVKQPKEVFALLCDTLYTCGTINYYPFSLYPQTLATNYTMIIVVVVCACGRYVRKKMSNHHKTLVLLFKHFY